MMEKRKFMRFEAMLDVIYSMLGKSAEKNTSYLKNLSKDGIRLFAGRPLKKGSLVELEMQIPGDNIPVFALGEVAWIEASAKSKYDSGIRFTKIENNDRIRLLDYVYDQWISAKKKSD